MEVDYINSYVGGSVACLGTSQLVQGLDDSTTASDHHSNPCTASNSTPTAPQHLAADFWGWEGTFWSGAKCVMALAYFGHPFGPNFLASQKGVGLAGQSARDGENSALAAALAARGTRVVFAQPNSGPKSTWNALSAVSTIDCHPPACDTCNYR